MHATTDLPGTSNQSYISNTACNSNRCQRKCPESAWQCQTVISARALVCVRLDNDVKQGGKEVMTPVTGAYHLQHPPCLHTRPVRATGTSPRGEDTPTSLMATETKALTFAVLLLPVQIHVCRLMMDSWLDDLSAYCYSTGGNSRGSVSVYCVVARRRVLLLPELRASRLSAHIYFLSLSLVPHTHSRWRALRHCPAGGVGWGSGCFIAVIVSICIPITSINAI